LIFIFLGDKLEN